MNDTKYWIALNQTKGIGPASLKTIYDKLKSLNLSAEDLYHLTAAEIKGEFSFHDNIVEAVESSKRILFKVEEVYYSLIDLKIEAILFFEDSYPERFHKILHNAFPPVLYTYGNKKILKEKGAAILGEKDLSEKGESIAYLAAKELSSHNTVIIGNMAKGIDIVHRSALLNGGRTIGILPCGLMQFRMPAVLSDVMSYEDLLVVSPFFPDTEYNKFNAYARNRLICALSYAVYIVESAGEGGIFEAAKSAHKLGIPLFVTEYKEYAESASANKILIEEGAKPVKGRLVNNELSPNLDELIGILKYGK